jgi:hypothetical protein
MDFVEKATVRIEHWIHHNDHHREEYEAFAGELEGAGLRDAAAGIREMIALDVRGTDALKRALAAVKTSHV